MSKKNNGLTLVELLIVLVVMSLIMGGLVAAFISHSRISAAEESRMEVQQNLRVVTDRLKHVLRHAGFGCYDSFPDKTMIISEPQGEDDIEIDSFIFDINNTDVGDHNIVSDSLIFVYAFKEISSVNHKYFTLFPNIDGNIFYRPDEFDDLEDDINDNDLSILEVIPVRIFVSDDDEGYRLYLKNFAYNDRGQWILSESIEDISFQYYENGAWHADENTISDMNNIRKIRFWLLGRSKKSVPGAGQQDLEVVVDKDSLADDDICIDNVDNNKCVVYRVPSVDEEGRIRMLSRGEVTLRNAVLN